MKRLRPGKSGRHNKVLTPTGSQGTWAYRMQKEAKIQQAADCSMTSHRKHHQATPRQARGRSIMSLRDEITKLRDEANREIQLSTLPGCSAHPGRDTWVRAEYAAYNRVLSLMFAESLHAPACAIRNQSTRPQMVMASCTCGVSPQ